MSSLMEDARDIWVIHREGIEETLLNTNQSVTTLLGVCPGCHGKDYDVETSSYDGANGVQFTKSYACFTCGCEWEEVYDARPLGVYIDRQPQLKQKSSGGEG